MKLSGDIPLVCFLYYKNMDADPLQKVFDPLNYDDFLLLDIREFIQKLLSMKEVIKNRGETLSDLKKLISSDKMYTINVNDNIIGSELSKTLSSRPEKKIKNLIKEGVAKFEKEANKLEIIIYDHREAYRHFDLLNSNPFSAYEMKYVQDKDSFYKGYKVFYNLIATVKKSAKLYSNVFDAFQEKVKGLEKDKNIGKSAENLLITTVLKTLEFEKILDVKAVDEFTGFPYTKVFFDSIVSRGFRDVKTKFGAIHDPFSQRNLEKKIFPDHRFREIGLKKVSHKVAWNYVISTHFKDMNYKEFDDEEFKFPCIQEFFNLFHIFLFSEELKLESGIEFNDDLLELSDPDDIINEPNEIAEELINFIKVCFLRFLKINKK